MPSALVPRVLIETIPCVGLEFDSLLSIKGIGNHFIEEYPYLKKNWKPLANEFGVTHLVVSKHELSLISWEYDFSELKKISENDKFAAYEVTTPLLNHLK